MYKLEQQGEYFTESSMRAREPLVWHEYIGEAWLTVITRVTAVLLYCTVVPLYGWPHAIEGIGTGQLLLALWVGVLQPPAA
jgi:hypothetical protein